MNIQLQKNTIWNLSHQPHAIVCGVSGSGKSMLLIYLLYKFAQLNSEIYIIDPKISDLFQLGQFLPNGHLATDTNSTISILERIEIIMNDRQKEIVSSKRFGIDAYSLGFHPVVLFYDELAALTTQITKKETKQHYESLLKNIILKGRSAGIQVVFSLQQPNATNLPTEIREQCSLKICLGVTTPISTREMIFGKQSNWIQPPLDSFGVGWFSLGTPTVNIFEAPNMKNFNPNTRLIPLLNKEERHIRGYSSFE